MLKTRRGPVLLAVFLSSACLTVNLTPKQAQAQDSASASGEAAFAVPVEKLPTGKAKGKFLETAFSIGEYQFFSTTSMTRTNGAFSVTLLGSDRNRATVMVNFRFTKNDSPVSSGLCAIESKSWSGLWNTTKNGLYTCKLADTPATDTALEVDMPNIPPSGHGGMSMHIDDPDRYKNLKARMLYKGVTYEAVPTALDRMRENMHARVAQGYLITRDGKPVGRIDFDRTFQNKAVITAPVAAEDGREAVIFLCAQLIAMPEANSPALK